MKTHEIVIGVDPHKASWTAAVMNSEQHVLGKIRVATIQDGYQQLRNFTAAWPQAMWAVEGTIGLGAPLTARLLDSGATVIDVPAKLSARVRMLDRGHSPKTDEADAVSTAAAAMGNDSLRPVVLDSAAQAMRLLSDRRDDLIAARTLVINRVHATLVHLIPGGAATSLSAPVVAQLLESVRPRDQVNRTRRGLAKDLLADLRRLDSQITALDKDITQAVRESGSTLTALFGLGPVLAARILGRVGDVDRFPSEAHFASYCGAAPIEASSGDTIRHRLSRSGDRTLNHALHMMAITQVRPPRTGAPTTNASGLRARAITRPCAA
jgi:transposase